MVLASMAGVLAVTALALQLAPRRVQRPSAPARCCCPFALLTLPVLAVTAAAAVLFETVPVLRGGLGNIVWFFVWMICAIAGAGRAAGRARHRGGVDAPGHGRAAPAPAGEFSLGFTKVDHPLRTFIWHGLEPSGGFVVGRLVLIVVAAGLAALPAAWFGRFDPARGRPRRAPAAGRLAADGAQPGCSCRVQRHRARRPGRRRPRPTSRCRRAGPAGLAAGRLLAGEVRILVQGISRWWWLVAAAITWQPRRARRPGASPPAPAPRCCCPRPGSGPS